MHGKQCRIYVGTEEYSDELNRIAFNALAEAHDRTTFADGGWRTSDPGLKGWDGEASGFYDSASGQFAHNLETLLGLNPPEPAVGVAQDTTIISVYDGDADAVGDRGILTGPCVFTRRGTPIQVGGLVLLNAALSGKGSLGLNGVLLHPDAAETVSGNGASVDNGASTPNGGRANFHSIPPGNTNGTWTVKVEHSTDNSIWAALATFTIGAWNQTMEVAGTVNRYLRASWVEDVAGTSRFVLGFARY